MITNKKIILFLIITFLAGIFIGQSFLFFKKSADFSSCKNNFPFLNQSIACDLSAEKKLETAGTLEVKINNYIHYSKETKKASRVSVFFRDLSSKKWVGINQNENYAPASLLKLPLLVAYFKLSEYDPGLFSKKYVFQKIDPILYQNFKPGVELEQGKEYTIEEILRQMIVYSDNSAMNFLLQIIDENFLKEQYYQMGIYLDENKKEDLSAISYSNLLRMLYNSSCLTRSSSEKILDWMSKADFNDGLISGVPSGTAVAHKFGERIIDATTKELHDCGVIYYPDHPYILCVMTAGDNYDNLKEIISNISRLTYEEFKKMNEY